MGWVKYVSVKPHFAFMLVEVTDPLVDESMSIQICTFLKQIASVGTNQIEVLDEFVSTALTITSDDSPSLAFLHHQFDNEREVSEERREVSKIANRFFVDWAFGFEQFHFDPLYQ